MGAYIQKVAIFFSNLNKHGLDQFASDYFLVSFV